MIEGSLQLLYFYEKTLNQIKTTQITYKYSQLEGFQYKLFLTNLESLTLVSYTFICILKVSTTYLFVKPFLQELNKSCLTLKMDFDYYALEILLKSLLNSNFQASRTNVLIKARKSRLQAKFITKHLRFEKHFMDKRMVIRVSFS